MQGPNTDSPVPRCESTLSGGWKEINACVALLKHCCRHLTISIHQHSSALRLLDLFKPRARLSQPFCRFPPALEIPNWERNLELHDFTPVGQGRRACACIIWGRGHGRTVHRRQIVPHIYALRNLILSLVGSPFKRASGLGERFHPATLLFLFPFLLLYVYSFMSISDTHAHFLSTSTVYGRCNFYTNQFFDRHFQIPISFSDLGAMAIHF